MRAVRANVLSLRGQLGTGGLVRAAVFHCGRRVSDLFSILEHMSEAVADRVAGGVDDLTASDLLATIKSSRQVENAEAARQLVLAAQWADLHPPESIPRRRIVHRSGL
jgi:hypothetical protein